MAGDAQAEETGPNGAASIIAGEYIVERLKVMEPAKAVPDYVTYLKGSDLRRIRQQLARLRDASFGLGEVLMGASTLAFGAILGVLPTEVTGEAMRVFYYTILPVIGATTALAYFLLRKAELTSGREVAEDLLERLPQLNEAEDLGEQSVEISVKKVDGSASDSSENHSQAVVANSSARDDNAAKPLEELSYDDASFRYAMALQEDKDEEAAEVDAFLTKRAAEQGGDHPWRWAVDREFSKLLSKKGGSFDELLRVAAESNNNWYVSQNVAAAYRWIGDHDQSAKWFRLAAEGAELKAEKIGSLGEAAEQLAKAGDIAASLELCRQINAMGAETAQEKKIHAARTVALLELIKRPAIVVAVQEYQLELDPADHDVRFSVGFNHSEQDRDGLAVYHYNTIPGNRRTSSVWNNLGVAWNALEVAPSAAAAYLRAHEMGGTLATSNLANMLIDAGMLEDAQKLMESALKGEHDVRLDRSLIRLDDAKKAAEKKRTKILEEAVQLVQFFRRLGQSALAPLHHPVSGIFSNGTFNFEIEITDERITGKGYRRLSGLAAKTAGAEAPIPAEFAVKGDVFGRSIQAKCEYPVASGASLLISGNTNIELLMCLDVDGDKLICLEKVGKIWNPHTLLKSA